MTDFERMRGIVLSIANRKYDKESGISWYAAEMLAPSHPANKGFSVYVSAFHCWKDLIEDGCLEITDNLEPLERAKITELGLQELEKFKKELKELEEK